MGLRANGVFVMVADIQRQCQIFWILQHPYCIIRTRSDVYCVLLSSL